MRRPLVAGNWKMHGTRASVAELLLALRAGNASTQVDVVICPAFVHLAEAVEVCSETAFGVGAQDCSEQEPGACTGDVAAEMLSDLGCQWVILGHSERRAGHAETDGLVGRKLEAVARAGLTPILCVGETQAEREAGEAEAVVAAQLRGALGAGARPQGLVVAYEPVWAIGTGLTATPQQAQEMHRFIRGQLASLGGIDAEATRVLYGGSVKPDNAGELFSQADIDGGLIGGASLVAADFLAIVAAAA